MAESKGWETTFFTPIAVPKGKPLRTLHDARAYAIKLPKKISDTEPWQAALQAMLIAAECSNTMMAEIGVRTAINGGSLRAAQDKPGRADTGWQSYGRKKKDPWR